MLDKTMNIADLIEREGIITHFQPIISVKKKAVIGFEALSRGTSGQSGELIPPLELFKAAAAEGCVTDLDVLCMKKSLEGFLSLGVSQNDYFISLNMGPASVARISSEDQDIPAASGIPPSRILIEIADSQIEDFEFLKDRLAELRKKGFLIAIDNVGRGHSYLERISLLKPDVIKIDASLIEKIGGEYHNREIIKSLASLAHSVGSLVIAVGVETEGQAILVTEIGIDMLQGFYFASPGPDPMQQLESTLSNVQITASGFQRLMVRSFGERKNTHRRYNQIINDLVAQLSKEDEGGFEPILKKMIQDHPGLECLYVLDERGIQACGTIFAPGVMGGEKGFFFKPGQRGTDQSSKEYYFLVAAGFPKFTTKPYVSLASRNVCITVSVAFRDINYKKYILCMDILHDEIRQNT
jgi:EAL domain-containing protein (putative c-di-GMP-specific phosphodiesterase class I)